MKAGDPRARVLAVLLAAAVAAPVTGAQNETPLRRVDVSALGPQVGARVPDFSLRDQGGVMRTLQSVMGPRGAMLVFVRSADWCPFCRTQLVELQGRVADLQKRGIGLAAISYDSPAVLEDFSRRHGITYPMLADVGSVTIRRYGILNTVVEEALGPNGKDPAVLADLRRYATAGDPSDRHRGIPFPGTFMVDRNGRVTSRFFEDYYWERNTTSNILLRAGLGATPVQATEASTQHLTLRAYPSDAAVALGTRFSVAVDITPKRGIHVYAPGASNYKAIAINIAPQPHVRTLAVRYPPSEMYRFAPLDERVPVYQKPFSLVMDVVPEATPEGRKAFSGRTDLLLTGTIDYQACDDKICYNPVSLPISWKVELKPNVPGATQSPATR